MVPKWSRELSAKQLSTGSSPVHASKIIMPNKRKDLKIKGANLWYLVGLITSDGCLSSDGRHVNITSKEQDFLKNIKETFGFTNRIGIKNKGMINQAYYLQIANRNLYEFLLAINLMPNKSLKLKSLNIPKENFFDFLRGLIDGDGCLRSWKHNSNLHEQWSLRIFSGSIFFIKWLRSKIEEYSRCRGRIHSALRPDRVNPIYTLKYGKITAKIILQTCYYEGAFGLDRKIKLVQKCLDSSQGWGRSKTILN